VGDGIDGFLEGSEIASRLSDSQIAQNCADKK